MWMPKKIFRNDVSVKDFFIIIQMNIELLIISTKSAWTDAWVFHDNRDMSWFRCAWLYPLTRSGSKDTGTHPLYVLVFFFFYLLRYDIMLRKLDIVEVKPSFLHFTMAHLIHISNVQHKINNHLNHYSTPQFSTNLDVAVMVVI